MPCNDYFCGDCGAEVKNILTRLNRPPEVSCSCGGKLQVNFGSIRINAHWDQQAHHGKNSMYGKYHHGFDTVVRDYEHKQELLRENDVSEAADPVKGSRSWRDQMPSDRQTVDPNVSGAIEMTQEQYDEWSKSH